MDNSTGKTALALIAGIAAGAALGLLFAPRSGKETRAALRSKGEDMSDDLAAMVEQARKDWSKAKGKMADATTMTRDEVTDFVQYLFKEGKHMADRVKNDVAATANDAADKARRATEDHKQTARSN